MRDDCLDASINKRARHFQRKRRVADAFEAAGELEMAKHLRDCQEVNRQCICIHCATVFYIQDRCRSRVCPLCSYGESKKRGDWIEAMCRGMKFPKMLTLTMPRWTKDPAEGIKRLRTCWNLLRGEKCMDKVRGGVYQIELKPKDNGWHVHMHAILDCPFLPYQHVFSAWRQILKVPFVSIDIRAATTPQEQHYVAKYAAKAADYEGDIPQVVAWWRATKGQRLFATFGEWYNKQPPESPEGQEQVGKSFVCPHCGGVGTCCPGESVRFVAPKGMGKFYEMELAAAGPPRVDCW